MHLIGISSEQKTKSSPHIKIVACCSRKRRTAPAVRLFWILQSETPAAHKIARGGRSLFQTVMPNTLPVTSSSWRHRSAASFHRSRRSGENRSFHFRRRTNPAYFLSGEGNFFSPCTQTRSVRSKSLSTRYSR